MRDERIKYFKLPHQGVVAALNFGVQQATAQVITLIGSDDSYKPEHLALNLGWLADHSDVYIIYSNQVVIGSRLVPDITKLGKFIDVDDCYHEGTMFLQRAVCERISFEEGVIVEGYRFVQKRWTLAIRYKN